MAAGLSALVFGAAHFKYAQFAASMVPAWLPPNQIFWAYATGVGHLAAGLALLSGIRAPLGATLLAVMMALFVLLVHVPRVIAAPGEHLEWIMLGVALSLSGSAWVIRKHATTVRAAEGDRPTLCRLLHRGFRIARVPYIHIQSRAGTSRVFKVHVNCSDGTVWCRREAEDLDKHTSRKCVIVAQPVGYGRPHERAAAPRTVHPDSSPFTSGSAAGSECTSWIRRAASASTYHDDERFAMASTFKLALAAALRWQVDHGAFPLEHTLPVGGRICAEFAGGRAGSWPVAAR